MTRLLFSICVLLTVTLSFGQKGDTLLNNAYKSKSLTKLKIFFDNWTSETPVISNEDFRTLNDTANNIYQVFQSFYNPKDIDKIGGSEWGNNIYKKVSYYLLQDDIRYGVSDDLMKDVWNDTILFRLTSPVFHRATLYDTLKNFRPQVILPDTKAVTLTKYYFNLLNRFLGDKHYKLGTGNFMSPAHSKGESKKRKQFLENYIKIWYGHWGGYWQLHSYPYVSRITFDKNFNNAVVDYRMIYEGGYAYFKKAANEWKLIKAERTWIE